MPERRMELLAPAGDERALRAAVQSGADAVYLGAGSFNARRNAGNFDGDGLRAAVAYCHARGVKVHVTLNTLVRQDELEALFDTIRQINASGADAVIVQDFGAARAVRQMAPALELHASTQMAAHNVQAARFLKAQGFDRVVLAREATFGDMADCVGTGIDVEVFVHGALCVSCSGQCLMSSFIGGRSGNRGLCAQPCRLPWKLGDREGYLLSTRDLCGLDDLARFREAGVSSLKIEGRMKRAEYVAVTVAAYRRALDALYEGRSFDILTERENLAQMFNRGGFTRGYGPGMKERELMYRGRPNHIGARVGACLHPGSVRLDADIDPSDTLVIRHPGREDVPVRLSGRAGDGVKCSAMKGDELIRLVSEAQMREARESFSGENRQVPIEGRATLRVGAPARLAVGDGEYAAESAGDVVERATGRPFDSERAAAQLKKTGGTPYRLDALDIEADADAFAPASMLNALRRDALERLTALRTEVRREEHPIALPELSADDGGKTLLYAQSGDPDVLRRALDSGADVAVVSPTDMGVVNGMYGLDCRRSGEWPRRFALAVPAVLTERALDDLNAWANERADRISETFLSNVGHLGLSWPGRASGDFLLNAANDLAVAQLNAWGMETVTPSVELTAAQIAAMGGRRNLVVWGRIPLMHLRNCPHRTACDMPGRHADCAHCGLTSKLNHPLVDRKGVAFPLRRLGMPGGCVVQVLNSVPLMPLKKMDRLPRASGWRLLLEPDEPIEAIARVYRAALDGEDFRALPEWQIIEEMQTTTGHYFRGVE